MKNITEPKRLPRPMGVTYLSIQYNNETIQTKKDKLKDRINQIIIEQYVQNGLQLNQTPIPINQIASFLNLDTPTVMRLMNRTMERLSKIFDKSNDNGGFARVSGFGLFFKSLEMAQVAMDQVHILRSQQGNKYVPFLSGELNRAIANAISAQKPSLEVLKLMTDKEPTNPFNSSNTVNQTNNLFITATEAVKILEQKGTQSLLTNPELIPTELAELGDLPEVGAKYQDLTKIGIKHKGIDKPKP